MKKLLLILLIACAATAQELTVPVKFMSSLKSGNEQYVASDAFGAVYTLQDNELHKRKEGVLLKYKALSLGDITRIDLQNPLQIVLFYRKFNTVVLLDNQLNEVRRINFSQLQPSVTDPIIADATGLASQNRLWVFDVNSQRLGLFDLAQNNFKAITPPFTESIEYYHTDYNYFYWIDAANKCYAANLFGKVTFLGDVPKYDKVQMVSSTEVLYMKDNALYLYSLQAGTAKLIELVEKTFDGFQYSAQILSIFTDSEINQYKITLSQ
jgi:hypothetical protein